jgi:hypothetical protein
VEYKFNSKKDEVEKLVYDFNRILKYGSDFKSENIENIIAEWIGNNEETTKNTNYLKKNCKEAIESLIDKDDLVQSILKLNPKIEERFVEEKNALIDMLYQKEFEKKYNNSETENKVTESQTFETECKKQKFEVMNKLINEMKNQIIVDVKEKMQERYATDFLEPRLAKYKNKLRKKKKLIRQKR